MPVIEYDFTEASKHIAEGKLLLDTLFGPPGEGTFAVSPGEDPDHKDPRKRNRPGPARFYRNTDAGRYRYLEDAATWEEEGRNNFFSSVVWSEDALNLPGQRGPLTIGDLVQPLSFWCLWCDVDKGLTDRTRQLLAQLTRHGALLSHSGGTTDEGRKRFHLRVLLDAPITDVEEFYRLNRWLAHAMNGEKYAPVSWLTFPGSTRYKSEYPGGSAPTPVRIKKLHPRWSVSAIEALLQQYADEPTGRVAAVDATDLVPEKVNLRGRKLFKIKDYLNDLDEGDGSGRYKRTNALVKQCAESGLTKNETLWVLEQHAPSLSKFGAHRLPSQVHACWPMSEPVEREATRPTDSLLTGMRDGEWLESQVFPPMVWSVPDIIPEGLGMLVAPPKAGKSWLVANIGLACASGGVALGRLNVEQRPVLYMALEDSHRRLQSRFKRLMGKDKLPKSMHHLIECDPNVAVATIVEFMQEHEKNGPLVIVDTLQKVRGAKGKNEDSYAADYLFGNTLKAAADSTPGASLILVHHTRKAESSDFMDSISGTQGLAGSMDFVLVLQRKRQENEAVLRLTGRDVEENSFALTFDKGSWQLDGVDLKAAAARSGRAELGDRAREVLEYVESRDGTTIGDVADEFSVTKNNATQVLHQLLKRELISKKGRGNYVGVGGCISS